MAKKVKNLTAGATRMLVHKLNRTVRELAFRYVSDSDEALPREHGAHKGDVLVQERLPNDDGKLKALGGVLGVLTRHDGKWAFRDNTGNLHVAEGAGLQDRSQVVQLVEAATGLGQRHPFKSRPDRQQYEARNESVASQQARDAYLSRTPQDKYVVVSKSGKILSRHPTLAKALQARSAKDGQKALSLHAAQNKGAHWGEVRAEQAAHKITLVKRKQEKREAKKQRQAEARLASKEVQKTRREAKKLREQQARKTRQEKAVMAKSKKRTSGKGIPAKVKAVLAYAKKKKVSLKSLAEALRKLAAGGTTPALPAPAGKKTTSKKPATGRVSKAKSKSVKLMNEMRRQVAAYVRKHKKKPSAAWKAAQRVKNYKKLGYALPKATGGKKPKPGAKKHTTAKRKTTSKKRTSAAKRKSGPGRKHKATLKALAAANKKRKSAAKKASSGKAHKTGGKKRKSGSKKPASGAKRTSGARRKSAGLKLGQAILAHKRKHGKLPSATQKAAMRKAVGL